MRGVANTAGCCARGCLQPRTSVYVALPVTLHEAESSHLPLTDPSMHWRLSFWSGSHRVSDDATQPVASRVKPAPPRSVTPRSSPVVTAVDAAASTGSASDDRVIRFDFLPQTIGSGSLSLRVELVHGDAAVAYCTTAVTVHNGSGILPPSVPSSSSTGSSTQQQQQSAGIVVQGVDRAGAPTSLQATPAVTLSPLVATPVNAVLFSCTTKAALLLATFTLTLCRTRMFQPNARWPAVAPVALSAADFLLPGRDEVYVTVEGVVEHPLHSPQPEHPLSQAAPADFVSCGELPRSVKAQWPSYTIVMVLSRGNGELVAGPLLLGATRCSPVLAPSPSERAAAAAAVAVTVAQHEGSNSHAHSALPLGLVESTGGRHSHGRAKEERQGHHAAAVAGCSWLGTWRRMVRVGLPEETLPAAAFVGKSHLHLLFYFLSQPSSSQSAASATGRASVLPSAVSGKPVVVGFSYLVLHPDSPDALIPDGSHMLKVGSLAFAQCRDTFHGSISSSSLTCLSWWHD